jgi:hypothetical protein
MPKKQGKPKIQTSVTLEKCVLLTMLAESHELGYRTGLRDREQYVDEQRDDCMGVVEERFDICNN